jgi:mRNA interferase MazF
MKRGKVWTVSGDGYAGKPCPAVTVQNDRFDATASVMVSVFTSDETEAPLFRLPVCAEQTERPALLLAPDGGQDHHVSKERLGERIGCLNDEDMVRLNRAILVFLGLA